MVLGVYYALHESVAYDYTSDNKTTKERETMDTDIDTLMDIMSDGVATLDCGCVVEPDGTCPCGNNSPLIDLGMI